MAPRHRLTSRSPVLLSHTMAVLLRWVVVPLGCGGLDASDAPLTHAESPSPDTADAQSVFEHSDPAPAGAPEPASPPPAPASLSDQQEDGVLVAGAELSGRRCPSELGELPRNLEPGYAIALRVHTPRSGMSQENLCAVLAEANQIWWSQTGLCFDIEVVGDDVVAPLGLDMWFEKTTPFPNGIEANGVYVNSNEIFSLDAPQLALVREPVDYPAARTAAHELGHALGLRHQDCGSDCDELLMRSGTMGFRLTSASPADVDEVAVARDTAVRNAAGPLVSELDDGMSCKGAALVGLQGPAKE